MATNSFLTSIPKLKGRENYDEWAFAAENLLILEGVADCIKQERPAATATATAVAEDAKEAIYLRMLLCELTGSLHTVKLYNDSQSAQKLEANHVCYRKSKHINIRYHFVKDVVNDKIINLKYLPTTAMPADVLTKALSPMKHYKCMEGIGMFKC